MGKRVVVRCLVMAVVGFLIMISSYNAMATGDVPLIADSQCLECHEESGVAKDGVHKNKRCVNCHIDIKELPHAKEVDRIDCSLCHKTMGDDSMGMDVHQRARENGNLNAPDCKSCHGAHSMTPRTNDNSPMNPANMKSFCITCHKDVEVPENYHKPTVLNRTTCQGCHSDKKLKNAYVDYEEFNDSIHKVLECVNCHDDVEQIPHQSEMKDVDCGKCHVGAKSIYKKSIHGEARNSGNMEAPTCKNCHGTHGILPERSEDSRVTSKNVINTCGDVKCHSNPDLPKKYDMAIDNPYLNYTKSIHYKSLMKGDNAASCKDCHGWHEILPMANPMSKVFKGNVPKTCSQCHQSVYEDFVNSVHWKGYLKGVGEAPVCTDCHLEHGILAHTSPDSMVFSSKVPGLCTDCHENARIAERFGFSIMSLDSYNKSYHGLAQSAGNIAAANCISCHTPHNILQANDPDSPVNSKNLGKTCGKCHLGVNKELLSTKIHEVNAGIGGKVIRIVKTIYIYLITFSVLGMLMFTFLDLLAKVRHQREHGHPNHDGGKMYVRFVKMERLIHIMIFTSFIILVYTGFAHKFPDAAWAWPVTKLMPFIVRDWLHRIAGIIQIITMVMIFGGFALTKRGREQFGEMLPKPGDAADAVNMFRHNLNPKNKPAHPGRFSFVEKFEFWALMWGSLLMTVTGLGLWFKEVTLNFFPGWVVDLFLTLHYYEALLATLAILIWHFYWVMFNPHCYPMDTTWIHGMISEERMKEEHPAEWEKLAEKEKEN